MRPVRDLFGELVERRLWPIALVLVLALVAVPVLLAKSPSDATEDAAVTTPPSAAAASATRPAPPLVTVAEGPGPSAPLHGREKNPFRQQHVPPEENGGGAGSSGGGASGGTGGGTGQQPPAKVYWYPSIDVRFGRIGTDLGLIEDVPSLAPLPRTRRPVAIFLGVLRTNREIAGFLVSTDVHVRGLRGSACRPSRKLCQVIWMRRGDVAFLDYTEADGDVVQYELDLVDLVLRTTTSLGKANDAYARSLELGQRALRRAFRRAERSRVARAQAVTGTTPQAPLVESLP